MVEIPERDRCGGRGAALGPLSVRSWGGEVEAQSLRDRSVLVVGASAGIGKAVALRAAAAGGRVVMAGRRRERLDRVVEEAGSGLAVVADVRRAEDCERLVAEAVGELGPIDVVIYCAGVAPLRLLEHTTVEDWGSVLDTHVVGAHQTVRAVLPVLSPDAVVVVLSSETVGRPRLGLGAYGASKAALEETIRAWRNEHPRIRFTAVAVGATFPTEFGDSFDSELLPKAIDHWTRHGLMTEEMLDPGELAGTILGVVGTALRHPGVAIERMVLRPPSPAIEGGDAG
jgi:NAD(P)-dependent dehydrogenase (short-subunit alcohol dehydrogenase family)